MLNSRSTSIECHHEQYEGDDGTHPKIFYTILTKEGEVPSVLPFLQRIYSRCFDDTHEYVHVTEVDKLSITQDKSEIQSAALKVVRTSCETFFPTADWTE